MDAANNNKVDKMCLKRFYLFNHFQIVGTSENDGTTSIGHEETYVEVLLQTNDEAEKMEDIVIIPSSGEENEKVVVSCI